MRKGSRVVVSPCSLAATCTLDRCREVRGWHCTATSKISLPAGAMVSRVSVGAERLGL